jgi:periplasmic divalent cation tolerance protein
MGNLANKKSKSSDLKILYVVYPDKFNIDKLINQLTKKKLIVCVNIIPKVKSYYLWKSKCEKSTEMIALFKTSKKKLLKLKGVLKENHPYEVPLICELGVHHVNSEYLTYLLGEIS